jgi:hypothetical protein
MIRFRVNKEQFERIKLDALNNGYLTPSAYLRDLALNRNLICLDIKVSELSNDMKRIKEVLCNG